MTATELKDYITSQLAVPLNQVSKLKSSLFAMVDFTTSTVATIIPYWTSALTFNTDGTGAGVYCTYADTTGKNRLWQTLTDGNINNAPPTNPSVTSNAYWEEISSSASAAIPEWAPGLYGPGLIIVFHNHSVDGKGLYVLNEPVRPFNSVNIETEITALKWELISGGSTGGTAIDEVYANIAAMLADQSHQEENAYYWVTTAATDPTVTSGWAIYRKLAASTANLTDYVKVQEQESLDIVATPDASETVKGKAEISTQAETHAGTDDFRFVTPLKLATEKDATGGIVGMTLFKINFKNAANTNTSFLANTNTVARTYTFQDRDGTIADNTDLALKANLASPIFTGTPLLPTAATGTNNTQGASTAFVQDALKQNTVGDIIIETWATLTNWTNVGSGTFSVASNILTVNGGTPASITLTNYRRQSAYGYSNIEDFTISYTQTVGTINSTSHGIAIGLQRQSGTGGVNIQAGIILNSGTDKGKIAFYYDNTTLLQQTTASLSVTTGDVLNIKFTRNKGRLTYAVINTTTNRVLSNTYELSYVYPSSILIPSAFNYSIYAWGGTHTIATNFKVTSNVIKGADLLLATDSRQAGHWMGNISSRMAQKVTDNYNALVVVNGGPGLATEGLNAAELIACEPKKIMIMIGFNNIYAGDSPATMMTKLATLVSSLTGYTMGTNLFISTFEASTTTDITSANSSIVSTYTSSVLDFYPSSWSGTSFTLNSSYDVGDGLHLNAVWARIQAEIVASYFGYKSRKPNEGAASNALHIVDNVSTTTNVFDVSSSSITTGSLFKATSTSTALNHTVGTNGLLSVRATGSNSTANKIVVAGDFNVANTGSNASNIAVNAQASNATTNYGGSFTVTGGTYAFGLYATASGATNNHAAWFNAGTVSIGTTVGLTDPSINLKLNIHDTNSDVLIFKITNDAAASTGSFKYLSFGVYGTSAFSTPSLQNVGIMEVGTNGGAMINSLYGPLQLTTTLSRTPRLTIDNSTGNISINGVFTATAKLHIAAGTATASTAPFKLTSSGSGVTGLLTTAEKGAIEFTDRGLWFSPAASVRDKVLHGLVGASAPSTTAIGSIADYFGTSATRVLTTPNTWISVVGDDGSTYKIPAYS